MNRNEVSISLATGVNTRNSEFVSPDLDVGTNLSLTIAPGEAAKPHTLDLVSAASVLPRALAATTRSENVVVYPGVDQDQTIVTPSGAHSLKSKLVATAAQNMWRPFQVSHSDSSATPGGSYFCTVLQTTGSGNVLRAIIELDPVSSAVRMTLSATDSAHRIILQPTVLSGAAQPKLLDLGSDDAALVYLDTGAILTVRKLSFAAGAYTIGSPVALTTALATSVTLALYGAASTGTEAAIYLVYVLNSASTTAVVSKYSLATSSVVWSNTYATARASTSWTPGIDAALLSGTIYVSAAWADTSGVESVILDGSSGSTLRSRSTRVSTLKVRVAPFMAATGGIIREVIATTTDTFGLSTPTAVRVYVSDVANTFSTVFVVDAHNLAAPEAAQILQGSDRLPCYALAWVTDPANADDTTDPNYVVDPSIELYAFGRVDSSSEAWAGTPIARLGVDRAYLQSRQGLQCNAGLGIGNGNIQVAFQKDQLQAVEFNQVDYELAYPVRCAVSGGVALVAAAQPVYWDGVETVELSGPLHVPMMTPVGGTLGSPGIRYRCLVMWRDASGDLHRSAPSAATAEYTAAPTGFAVAWPNTFRDGKRQDYFGVEIYSQDPATSQSWYLTLGSTATTATVGTYSFITSATGAINTANPELYSDGSPLQELVPEAPPAMWDVAFASGRAWYIDATRRNVAGFSKLPQPGIGIEFNAALQVTFPVEAGNLIAVQDMGGVPVFFAERGVYVVLGDGPDNLGQGVFATPRLAAAVLIHPESRNSTVRTPVGIFFRTMRGYAILTADYQIKYLEKWLESNQVVRATAVVRESTNEVMLVPNGDTIPWAVYNYLADAWTTWDYQARFAELGTASPVANAIAFYDRQYGDSRTYVFTGIAAYTGVAGQPELNSSWEARSSWTQPGGIGGRLDVHEVLVYVRPISGSGSIVVTIWQDYDGVTPTATQTFSVAEIAANRVGNLAVLRVKPGKGYCRSIKVSVASVDSPYYNAHPIQAIVRLTAESGSNTRAGGALK